LDRLDMAVARWPTIPFFLAARLKWAATVEDWKTVEALSVEQRDQALQHRAGDVSAWIDFCREPDVSAQGLERLLQPAFALGTSGLQELLLHAKHAGLSQTLSHLAEAGTPPVQAKAPRRPDDLGSIALWLPVFDAVRADRDFGRLLDIAGLALECGRWVEMATDQN
jgi:hypothetical protein